jgi:4,5-DOPA dioxygenase extradiol
VRVGAGEAPPTVHDHPVRALYGTRYTAPGSLALARRIQELLKAAGVDSRADVERGFDHGAWVPLSLLAPEARIPVVQVSLDARGEPEAQVALGRALAPLREEGVLLVGSGGVTHDQEEFRRRYFAGVDPYAPPPESHQGFEAWVTEVVVGQRGGARMGALGRFREHPLARHAHPTDEHLLPLLVVVAAAGEAPGRKLFEGRQNGLSTSAFGFGAW